MLNFHRLRRNTAHHTDKRLLRFVLRFVLLCLMLPCVLILSACTTTVALPPDEGTTPTYPTNPGLPSGASLPSSSAVWIASDWASLPGFTTDNLDEAWHAWLESCKRPRRGWQAICPEVQTLSYASEADKRAWMQRRLQPYRLENRSGSSAGKLTSYYEPAFDAARSPSAEFAYPLYSPPPAMRQPWFDRRSIETRSEAINALRGRDWAYLRSPIDALNLHIQGSAKLHIKNSNGAVSVVRAAFAGTNGHPFRSPFQWLIQTGELRNPNWQSVESWVQRSPSHRVQEMLHYNPRYIFFREEAISNQNPTAGPKGAEGVPLTAGRSIAVDPRSIPYGSPVWIASNSSQATLNRLVYAQDTGSAIVGAIRADYFAGTGSEAGLFAQRINQPLQVWVLWPR